MLKTYRDDIQYVDRLLESFERYNSESIHLYIVAPRRDRGLFTSRLRRNVSFIEDEDLPEEYENEPDEKDRDLGHWNPGVVRLGFWKLGLSENYFAIDSDMVFVREFKESDFVTREGIPIIATSNNLDEITDPFYFERYWSIREEAIGVILKTLGGKNSNGVWIHNSQVFNASLLKDLETYIRSTGIPNFKALMEIAPYEFFWYSAWVLNQSERRYTTRSDFVKMVNHQGEHLSLWQKGVREADLGRGYVGVIVNSNWSRQYGLVGLDNPPVSGYQTIGKWAEWRALNLPGLPDF